MKLPTAHERTDVEVEIVLYRYELHICKSSKGTLGLNEKQNCLL